MKNINEILKAIDKKVNEVKPSTMDALIECVHSVPGAGDYGTHFRIVKYKGYLQGVRVYVTGRTKSHPLPAQDKAYSVFKGLEKYEAQGWPVEYTNEAGLIVTN